MRFSRGQSAVALLASLLLCSLVVTVIAGAPAAATSGGGTADAGVDNIATEGFEADQTLFRITVRADGNATWSFQYAQRLESDDEIEDFERYAERFNEEETESYRNFRERASSLTESGQEVTGRNMTADGFDREARIEERAPGGDEFAVIEMSFVWTDFAERDDDRLVVGDVFIDGLYIGPEQELRFERGPTLRFESVDPTPDSIADRTLADSETISWVGETQFTDRRPRVVYLDQDAGADPDSMETNADSESDVESDSSLDPGSEPGETSPNIDTFVPLVVIVVILLGVVGAIAYRSKRERDSTVTEDTALESASTSRVDSDTPIETDVSTENGPISDSKADRTAIKGGTRNNVETAIPDEELLSDEERVVGLLEAHGGRMKQVDIVKRTDWSKSKVSMLLSEMEKEGTISKLRVGRENIISLAGHEPEAAGSPFDDEA